MGESDDQRAVQEGAAPARYTRRIAAQESGAAILARRQGRA